MDDKVFDDIEIAPPSVVKRTARDFAAALAETSIPMLDEILFEASLTKKSALARKTEQTKA